VSSPIGTGSFLAPDLAKNEENLERFFREARAASRIKSEHVIRVLDVGISPEGLPFIVVPTSC
jgi:serine/threonine-protein kinase